MYGCETWTLPESERNKLVNSEGKFLRRIFRPYQDEETGESGKTKNQTAVPPICQIYGGEIRKTSLDP